MRQRQASYQERLRQYEAAKQRIIATAAYADARDLERKLIELARRYNI